jgi:hypothetical protein
MHPICTPPNLELSFDPAAALDEGPEQEVLNGSTEKATAAVAAVPKNLRLDSCPNVLVSFFISLFLSDFIYIVYKTEFCIFELVVCIKIIHDSLKSKFYIFMAAILHAN